MSKPELPPLPRVFFVGMTPAHERALVHRAHVEEYGLACYRAGMLRAAEVILQHKNDYNGAQIDPLLAAIGERAAIDAATRGAGAPGKSETRGSVE